MNDAQLLAALEAEIPVLEEKLRAMKVTRKALKASQAMRAKRRDPAFNAKNLAAVRQRLDTPEERQRWATIRNNGELLPFAKGTPKRSRYRNLVRKGWSRELAIEKINAEAA